MSDATETSALCIAPTTAVEGEGVVLMAGTVVDEWTIVRNLGEGGFATVYEAHRTDDPDVRVAIKVLSLAMSLQRNMVSRFDREVQVVLRIKHPSIVEIFNTGMLPDGRPYYTMELLKGQTLRALLGEGKRYSPAEMLELVTPLCHAVAAAHAAGIIHRDVKAQNIMVLPGPDGRLTSKLLDFGIAKILEPEPGERGLTEYGDRLGSAGSMAPEQVLGIHVDARTDIYALGVLFYALLTGQVPFTGKPQDVRRAHLEVPAPRPSRLVPVPPELDAVVQRCMAKSPDARFASVELVLEALRQAVEGSQETTGVEQMGVGLFFQAAMRPDIEVDDVLLDELALVLEQVESQLSAGGLSVAFRTANSVLGVHALASAHAQTEVERLRQVASALLQSLNESGSGARFRLSAVVHRAGLSLGTQGDAVGGELLQTNLWVPGDVAEGVVVTAEARQSA